MPYETREDYLNELGLVEWEKRRALSIATLRAEALTYVDRAFGTVARIVAAREHPARSIPRYMRSLEREARVRRLARERIERAFNGIPRTEPRAGVPGVSPLDGPPPPVGN